MVLKYMAGHGGYNQPRKKQKNPVFRADSDDVNDIMDVYTEVKAGFNLFLSWFVCRFISRFVSSFISRSVSRSVSSAKYRSGFRSMSRSVSR